MEIAFTVPGVPTAQGRPRFVRATGRTHTDPKTRKAANSVADRAADAMEGRPPFDCPVEMTVVFAFLWPTGTTKKRRADPAGHWKEKKPDLSNLIKLVEDGINGIVVTDDARITTIVADKIQADVTETRVTIRPKAGALFDAKPAERTRSEQQAVLAMEAGNG